LKPSPKFEGTQVSIHIQAQRLKKRIQICYFKNLNPNP
jgi:hypothetical protein